MSSYTFSQSIKRSVYSGTSGCYANTGSVRLQSNVGELVVPTYTAGSSILTQGFIQPELMLTTSNHMLSYNPVFSVFPNPISDQLNIKVALDAGEEFEIQVFDIIGKMVYHKKEIANTVGDNLYLMDLSELNSAYNCSCTN